MERLLEMIGDDKRSMLAESGEIRRIRRGETPFLFKADEEDAMILLDGFISLSRENRLGASRVVMVCAAGDMLNEEVIAGEPCFCTAVALSDAELLCIGAERLRELADKEPDIGRAVFESMTKKCRRLYHQLGSSQGSYPVRVRIAARLLKLGRDFGTDTPEGRRIDFRLSISLLAEMTGTKRETVSRCISSLKKQGCICVKDSFMVIKDTDMLKENAGL